MARDEQQKIFSNIFTSGLTFGATRYLAQPNTPFLQPGNVGTTPSTQPVAAIKRFIVTDLIQFHKEWFEEYEDPPTYEGDLDHPGSPARPEHNRFFSCL